MLKVNRLKTFVLFDFIKSFIESSRHSISWDLRCRKHFSKFKCNELQSHAYAPSIHEKGILPGLKIGEAPFEHIKF